MLGLQFNRKLVRQVLNSFFTGDPKEHPELAAVLKEMGLSGDNKILGASHPLVVAAAARSPGEEFILAPLKATERSSVLHGTDAIFVQFRHMLGERLLFRQTQSESVRDHAFCVAYI
jgi:hypothetical protein